MTFSFQNNEYNVVYPLYWYVYIIGKQVHVSIGDEIATLSQYIIG